MLPDVFEMFTQADRSLERSQGGLGIGLTLVRRLVEMHGGTAEAHSDGPGHGSTFIVRLPVAPQTIEGAPRTDRDGDEAIPSGRRRILVADDNRDSADSLGMMLTILGNDVRTAYDGAAALDTAAAYQPDVMFLDIGMPKLNGFDAARRIREQAFGQHTVLVAITGWGQPEDRKRSEEAGFDFHLVKQVSADHLKALLHSLDSPRRVG